MINLAGQSKVNRRYHLKMNFIYQCFHRHRQCPLLHKKKSIMNCLLQVKIVTHFSFQLQTDVFRDIHVYSLNFFKINICVWCITILPAGLMCYYVSKKLKIYWIHFQTAMAILICSNKNNNNESLLKPYCGTDITQIHQPCL